MTTTVIKKETQKGEFTFTFDVHLHLHDGAKSEKTEEVKIIRSQGDQLTSLNVSQTALLIQFMQQTRMILSEQRLSYLRAGTAFNILTGFSTHSLRQRLGTKGEVDAPKFEDYEELHTAVMKLARLIEANIYKSKRHS